MKYLRFLLLFILVSSIFVENAFAAIIINRKTGEEIRINCDSYSCDNLIFKGPGLGTLVLPNSEYLSLFNKGILERYNTREDIDNFPVTHWMYDNFVTINYAPPFTPISVLLHIVEFFFVTPTQLIRKNALKRQAYRVMKKVRKTIGKDKTLKLSNRRFEMVINIIAAGAFLPTEQN